ncbi:type II secretion system F family protein [Maridesulfovibrio sp.]|uniref:type II secretion system F family protein n=1 Tax=Maridesulfovibrio sp. TaxID=2795000 RepID=UPI0029C9D774|nr:type II secretion system F family protein [Maridesulfovibrio sp.]
MQQPDLTTIIAKLFFGDSVRIRFYRKLSALTRHGVSAVDSVSELQERYAKQRSPLARVLTEVSARLDSGSKLDEAMHGFVPAEEVMLINSGVNSGKLYVALELAIRLIQARMKIISSMRKALAYPILLICALISLLVVLSRYAMPQFAQLSNPEHWAGGARALYLVSSFIDSTAGTILFAGIIVAFLLSLATIKIWTGKIRVRFDSIPPWSFYRLIIGSLWLFTLSTLMKSGIQLSQAIKEMLSTPGTSPWLKERLQSVKAQLNLGKGLGQALDDSGYQFPTTEIIEDLRIYSRLPNFDSQLHLIAEEMLTEGTERIKAQAKFINIFCIISIVAVVSNIVLAISSIQQQLGQNITY